uniref:N-acetyltransferase domain-containing protein n=1 Tax=viral metagenome TaxID=1070528 RepID=A0A6C0AWJ8_9ZZZZ|tara:strand:+ start:2602 stop:3054 length:453 start_codon:yes stop_codon:yes gene_type:complete
MIKQIEIKDKKFIFRKLKLDDITEDYFKLLKQLTYVDEIDDEKNKNFFKRLNSDHQIIVITHENNIIGSGTLFVEHKLIRDYGKVGHIEDIVIDKKHNGCGLGKHMIETLKELASKRNCYKCILDCDEVLERFYNKCEFNKMGLFMAKYI